MQIRDLIPIGLAFAVGGFVANLMVLNHLWSSHNKGKWPVTLRHRWYRFWKLSELVKHQQKFEEEMRSLYGLQVLCCMSDIGGPGPYPQSSDALYGLLNEAERRYQLVYCTKGFKF